MDWYEVDRWATIVACGIIGFFGPIGIGLIAYQWAAIVINSH